MLTLDKSQLDELLNETAVDYSLDLTTQQGLTAALLLVNTLLQLENTRLLHRIDEGLNG